MSDSDQPLVSVIVRSIDRPELEAALASVSAQTYPNIEIVLVNARGEEHRTMAERCGDHELRVVTTGEPLHRSRAANLGLEAARGDLLIFLDDDDWFLPHHIASLVDALHRRPEAGGAYAAVECLRADPQGQWQRVHTFSQPFDRVRLLVENFIPMHAILFRRELLEGGCRIDESLDVYEDWDFWIQLSREADFVFVEPVGAIYRIGEESGFGVGGDAEKIRQGMTTLFRKWRLRWRDEELIEIARYAKYHATYHDLLQLYETQKWEVADYKKRFYSEHATYQQVSEKLQRVQEELELLQQEKVATENALTQALQGREREVKRLEARSALLGKSNEELNARLADMLRSHSWRFTRPLRVGANLLRRGKRALKRYGASAAHLRREGGLPRLCGHALRLGGRKLRESRNSRAKTPARPSWCYETKTETLTFPTVAQPKVSVVVSAHHAVLPLFSCLKAIAGNSAGIDYEVLAVEDGADDESRRMLAAIPGLRIVTGDGARGALSAWQTGVQQARGEFVALLRGDELVAPQWLEHLLAAYQRFPEAGLIGSKIISPDWRIRAVGGIVWNDGTAMAYGQGEGFDAPDTNYVRRVDFCPGSGLLLRRSLCASFDTLPPDASAAAIELAFRVRESGKAVYVQPAATVVDFGGDEEGFAARKIETAAKDVWCDRLVDQPDPLSDVWTIRDRDAKLRMLVVDWFMVTPDQDSGSLRMFTMLEELAAIGVKVVFAIRRDEEKRRPYRRLLQQIGVEVLYAPQAPDAESYLQQHGRGFDFVLLSRLAVAEQLCESVRAHAPQAKLIFDTVDLHFLRERRMAELEGNAAQIAAVETRKQTEVGLMRASDVTLVVSQYEQALLKREFPDIRIEVLSNIHDVYGSAADFSRREGALFIGGFDHLPNIDAVIYYVEEILPKVRKELGSFKTWIIGSNPTPEVLALASEEVIVEGFVQDLAPHFARARMSVAPLRYGAGVKGKVNMSMAYGLPVVVSPIAAEGMALTHGFDALIGDGPEAFARCMVQLHRDEALWNTLSGNGLLNVETHFSRDAARRQLQKILFQEPA